MRRVGILSVAALLAACEAVAGIHEKTLVAADAADAGASDAAAAADPSAPCSQQPPFLYCDDFDTESSPGDTWDWYLPMAGGSVAFDSGDFASAPRSAQVIAPPTQQTLAQLGKKVGTLSTGFRLSFDLRVDVASWSSIPEVGVAQALAATDQLSINYVLGPGALARAKIFTASAPEVLLSLPLPPLHGWTRIALAYDATTGVAIEEDGHPVGSAPEVVPGAPGDTQLIVGAVYVVDSGTATTKLEIDDVVVRGK